MERKIDSKNSPVFDIWGACVTREIFNFCDLSVGSYMLQNPFHSIYLNPLNVDQDFIDNNLDVPNFLKRMCMLDTQKKAVEYFNEHFNGDYLIIDSCDARLSLLEFESEGNPAIVYSSTNKLFADKFSEISGVKYKVNYFWNLPSEIWEEKVVQFVNLIKSKYKEENILINRFNFSTFYVDEGNVFQFTNIDEILMFQKQTDFICDLLIKYLPHAKIIEALDSPLADKKHKTGFYCLHYTSEVYNIQALKIKALLNIDNISFVDVNNAIVDYRKDYNKLFSTKFNLIDNDYVSSLISLLPKVRLDFKNCGNSSNSYEIISCNIAEDSFIHKPSWLCKDTGDAFICQSKNNDVELKIKIIGDGVMQLWLRAELMTNSNEKHLPLFIEYLDFNVDGKNILEDWSFYSHDRHGFFEFNVKDNQVVDLKFNWKNLSVV